MGEEGTAAKKAKVIPSTQTAINGTTKWSFGDWTCRKCGAHNYRKQKINASDARIKGYRDQHETR